MKKLLKVTSLTALLTLCRMLAGFIVAKVVAVQTGPAGIAMLGQIQGFVSVITGIANSPLGNGIVRYTAEKQQDGLEECAIWWRASFGLLIGFLLVSVPLLIVFSNSISNWLFSQSGYQYLVIIAVLLLPFSAVGTAINSVTNGMQQYKRYVFLGACSLIVSTSCMLILVIKGKIHGALLAAVMQTALIGLTMCILSLRQPWFRAKYWFGNIDKEASKVMLGFAFMALTTALTVPVSLIFIRNLLVDNMGWEVTGQWQAVWKISEVYLGVVTMAMATYYLPKLATLKGKKAILTEAFMVSKVIIPVVILIAVGIYVSRDLLISILFTNEFSDASEFFLIKLIGDVVKIVSFLFAYPMIANKKFKLYIGSEIFFSVSLVLLSYLLIHDFGVNGVNLAYLVNYLLYIVFLFFSYNRICK
ncbi:O-antigen translocase [Pseudoalteromonas sp. J010]|uniref:O-antigen translocase n=1 Tax=Pseudoalteromonas sp. J010 TaxID=998465 RepID=UPI000F6454F0|nr:O-antigen translocase [Pseudoalteromonas sp. J010]RRS06912.1 O-antigen translocase [Pseudoalteromonas sp. J010]